MNKNIYIVSGEASGDLHGSNLVAELLKDAPELNVYAWGGDKMKAAGAIITKHYRELAFMGFIEVVKNLKTILNNFKELKKDILAKKPSVVVLIDYPGFNLRMARWLKENGFHVIYYIAPQAWAWKENRVKELAKYTDELLVILPFEEEFFKSRGVHTEFVGHPLLNELEKEEKIYTPTPVITLLPGSRKQEVSTILPEMLKMVSKFPNYSFKLAGMSHLGESFYRDIIKTTPIEIVWDNARLALKNASAALVSSGTATLETALLNVPQVVCYKGSWMNYQIGKRLIRVPYISLVNLIFGTMIVKELIQEDLNESNLFRELSIILHPDHRVKIQNDYHVLSQMLGVKDASKIVAQKILNSIT